MLPFGVVIPKSKVRDFLNHYGYELLTDQPHQTKSGKHVVMDKYQSPESKNILLPHEAMGEIMDKLIQG